MVKSERGPLDPPLDAALRYLNKQELPSDQELGTIINGVFKPNDRQNVQAPVAPRTDPVRRLLKTTAALLNF